MISTMIGHDGSDNSLRYQTMVDDGDEDDGDDVDCYDDKDGNGDDFDNNVASSDAD